MNAESNILKRLLGYEFSGLLENSARFLLRVFQRITNKLVFKNKNTLIRIANSCNNIDMNNSGLQKAINLAGTQTKLAELLGVYPQLVQSWVKTNVPPARAVQIERATKGAVTRAELRPDIFGDPYDPTDDAA